MRWNSIYMHEWSCPLYFCWKISQFFAYNTVFFTLWVVPLACFHLVSKLKRHSYPSALQEFYSSFSCLYLSAFSARSDILSVLLRQDFRICSQYQKTFFSSAHVYHYLQHLPLEKSYIWLMIIRFWRFCIIGDFAWVL